MEPARGITRLSYSGTAMFFSSSSAIMEKSEGDVTAEVSKALTVKLETAQEGISAETSSGTVGYMEQDEAEGRVSLSKQPSGDSGDGSRGSSQDRGSPPLRARTVREEKIRIREEQNIGESWEVG